MFASEKGYINILYELRINWELTTTDARKKDYDGHTALMRAAMNGHIFILLMQEKQIC
jgi:hypothetical protein